MLEPVHKTFIHSLFTFKSSDKRMLIPDEITRFLDEPLLMADPDLNFLPTLQHSYHLK